MNERWGLLPEINIDKNNIKNIEIFNPINKTRKTMVYLKINHTYFRITVNHPKK